MRGFITFHRGFNSVQKCISPKVNVIAQQEFEFVYFQTAVKYLIDYVSEISTGNILFKWFILYC